MILGAHSVGLSVVLGIINCTPLCVCVCTKVVWVLVVVVVAGWGSGAVCRPLFGDTERNALTMCHADPAADGAPKSDRTRTGWRRSSASHRPRSSSARPSCWRAAQRAGPFRRARRAHCPPAESARSCLSVRKQKGGLLFARCIFSRRACQVCVCACACLFFLNMLCRMLCDGWRRYFQMYACSTVAQTEHHILRNNIVFSVA